jgi:regulator of sigma E protease
VDFVVSYLLPFFGMLVGLVVIHELGHYVTAKIFGIKVLEAGIGYPPRIWGFNWRGTLYSINWLPLGGFVRLLGEEDPTDPQSLAAQAAWKRIIVLASGSSMNFVLPVILFALVFMLPREVSRGPAVIDLVEENSPAEQAIVRTVPSGEEIQTPGLQPGDRIIEINGERIKNTTEAGRIIRLNMGRTLTFLVGRDSFGDVQTLEARVKARWAPPGGQGPTGIGIHNQIGGSAVCQGDSKPDQCTETEQYSVFEAIPKGWRSTWESLVLARNQVITMVKGGQGPEVAGPVGIAQATGEVVQESGWEPLLEFAALLSINLAIINILPLPMLDGGRIAFVLLEIGRGGKRVAPEKEAIVHLIGLALIITMAVVVTYFDVARLIAGGSLFE